jgi:hypothetical protein
LIKPNPKGSTSPQVQKGAEAEKVKLWLLLLCADGSSGCGWCRCQTAASNAANQSTTGFPPASCTRFLQQAQQPWAVGCHSSRGLLAFTDIITHSL